MRALLPNLRLVAAIAAGLVVGVAACSGGAIGVGASCDTQAECGDELQCLEGICVPLCRRAPDCGDGHSCTEDGFCVAGQAQSGDRCDSEVECEAGLACVLDLEVGDDGVLDASCAPDHDGHPAGGLCDSDAECRSSTCALGRCVDVCEIDRDCAAGNACTSVPRIDSSGQVATNVGTFAGCIPSGGTIEWSIPVSGTSDEVFLPVPGNARSALAVMTIDDEAQYVGATRLLEPDSDLLYQLDLPAEQIEPFVPGTAVRHTPTPRASVMMIPSQPGRPLEPGAYMLKVSSFRLLPSPTRLVQGTASPRVKAVMKLGGGTVLDLHFYFLDLADHPCQATFGTTLNATSAPTVPQFEEFFVGTIRLNFARAGIALGATTYTDLTGHADLDGLDAEKLPDLLALSTHPGGVSVFLVRTITPVGLQVLVGGDKNPGDPSVGSPIGGVVIGIDAMCYRNWEQLARVASHGIARQMGLFRNIEPAPDGSFQDPIADTPGTEDAAGALSNLMHYSEFGGSLLTDDQREILRASAVLH
jgi:hypothetical protein